MNEFLYKFVTPDCKDITGNNAKGITQAFGQAIGGIAAQNKISGSMAKAAVPIGASGDINIAKNYRWTKTNLDSVPVHQTPVVTLRELQVNSPAFFNNISVLAESIAGAKEGDNYEAVGVGKIARTVGEQVDKGVQSVLSESIPNIFTGGAQGIVNSVGFLNDNLIKPGKAASNSGYQKTGKNYLKDYERLYGVEKTNFIYRMPYLQDSFKSISNSWGDTGLTGQITGATQLISDLTSLAAPGVGIDFAKTFSYPDSGPSHSINFYLDNTVVNGVSEHEKNFRLIYLLLYQNLPNKVSKSAILPPVIYQSFLPGVFSYRWSFLSSIVVNFVGNRRTTALQITKDLAPSTVVIPEGYEIQLTLTSLTPETKNLMYDSIDSPVVSDIVVDNPNTPERDPAGENIKFDTTTRRHDVHGEQQKIADDRYPNK